MVGTCVGRVGCRPALDVTGLKVLSTRGCGHLCENTQRLCVRGTAQRLRAHVCEEVDQERRRDLEEGRREANGRKK